MARILADLDQLTALKGTFDRESATTEGVLSTLRSQIADTAWEGPSASSFRAQWTSDFEPALGRLQSALQQVSGTLQTRIDEYMRNG